MGSIHKIKLGNAKVTIINPKMINNVTEDSLLSKQYTSFQSTFYISMNYLYEYASNDELSISDNTLLPLSIAHLQHSLIKKHDTFYNAIEIIFFDNNNEKKKSHKKKKKHLIITVNNIKERNDWFDKLYNASQLDIHDIYDYDLNDEDTVLGTGRYSTIVPATYKLKNNNKETNSSSINNHQRKNNKSAIKIIDKSIFFDRVSRSKERIDTLVRE